jgi:hypothetical protein
LSVAVDAFTIAMMPARTGCGRLGQALMSAANAGSISGLVENAPDFAPSESGDLTQVLWSVTTCEDWFESRRA